MSNVAVDIIKRKLLEVRLKEHFKRNPSAKSAIVKINFDNSNTMWKAERASNGFRVVEVSTKKSEYFLNEASTPVEQSVINNLMAVVGDAMASLSMESPASAHKKLTAAKDMIQKSLPSITDPKMRQQVGGMMGLITNLIDQTTAGAGPDKASLGSPSRKTGMVNAGRMPVKEADDKGDDDNNKLQDKSKDKKGNKPVSNKPSVEAEPEEPSDDMPLDLPAKKSSEEMQLQQMVQGKPIKNVTISIVDGDKVVGINVAGLKNPVEIHFSEDGKVFYKFGELTRVLKAL
jgi:hypothetical protein